MPYTKRPTTVMTKLWILFAMLVCLCALPVLAAMHPLPKPTTDVVLKISGNLSHPNHGDEVWLDLDTLKSLPSITYETISPWNQGVQSFTGVQLSTLFEAVGANPASFDAIAMDNYRVTLNDSDIAGYPVIVAYLQNGEPISIRKRGPLRIVFPNSRHPELQTTRNKKLTVWHLIKLELH